MTAEPDMNPPVAAAPGASRRRFALIAFLALGASLALWAVAQDAAASVMIAQARPLVEALAGATGLAQSIDAAPDGGWLVWTGRMIVSGPPGMEGTTAKLAISAEGLQHLLRTTPIFLALMAAPPYGADLILRVAAGLAAFWLFLVIASLAAINCDIAIMVNHAPSPVDQKAPPNFQVSARPYSEAAFFLAGLARYATFNVAPFILPVALWLALKPDALALLMRRDQISPSASR